MNKLTLLLLLTLLMSFQANAAEENIQQVAKYKSSLTELNQLGIKLHRLNDDPDDMEQLKRCVAHSNPLREKAKAIEKEILKSRSLGVAKMDLYRAAGEVFSCLYCSPSSVKSCSEAQVLLEGVKIIQ